MGGGFGGNSSEGVKRGGIGHASVEEMDSPQRHAVVHIVSHLPPLLISNLGVTNRNPIPLAHMLDW